MEIKIKKHLLTFEDFERGVFKEYHVGLVKDYEPHVTYNRFLQYYLIQLYYDALEASRKGCDCDRIKHPNCIDTCAHRPNEDKYLEYIEANKEAYRNKIYNKWAEYLDFKEYNCDNSCETFKDVNPLDLKYPEMHCPCDEQFIYDILPVENTPDFIALILEATERLDFIEEYKDLPEQVIEDFDKELIAYFNEQIEELWPDYFEFVGYHTYYDKAQGRFFKDTTIEPETLRDYGILNKFKGHYYKRKYNDKVMIAWFGLKDDIEYNTKVFMQLLQYPIVDFSHPVYGDEYHITLEIPQALEIQVSDSIHWIGNGIKLTLNYHATGPIINIKIGELHKVFKIQLDDIHFEVVCDNDCELFSIDRPENLDIFLFNSVCNLPKQNIYSEYLTNQEVCESDLYFNVLPSIPKITDVTNENQFINLGYLFKLQNDIENIMYLNKPQQVTETQKFLQPLKINVDLHDNRIMNKPLLKQDITDARLYESFNRIFDKLKNHYQYFQAQQKVQYPAGMYYTQVTDQGFFMNERDRWMLINREIAEFKPYSTWYFREVMQPNRLMHTGFTRLAEQNYYYTNLFYPGHKDGICMPTRVWRNGSTGATRNPLHQDNKSQDIAYYVNRIGTTNKVSGSRDKISNGCQNHNHSAARNIYNDLNKWTGNVDFSNKEKQGCARYVRKSSWKLQRWSQWLYMHWRVYNGSAYIAGDTQVSNHMHPNYGWVQFVYAENRQVTYAQLAGNNYNYPV